MNLSLRPLCLALLACGTFALQDAAQARPQKAQPAQVSAAASAPRAQDDLFAHVNADWLAQTEIPADKGMTGVFIALRDQSDRDIQALIKGLTAKPQKPGTNAQKVVDYYGSVLDTARIDSLGLAPLKPWLDEIAAIDSHEALTSLQGRWQGVLRTTVGAGVSADFAQPDHYVVMIGLGGLGLPDRDYYLLSDARMAKAREAYLAYLTTLFREAGDAQPEALAGDVMALETAIARIHWTKVELRDPQKRNNPMSVQALQELAPGIAWQRFFESAGLSITGPVTVQQPSYFKALAELQQATPLKTWQAYMKAHLLSRFASNLPKAFRDAQFEFQGRALSGLAKPEERWQQATGAVNGALGEALGELYVARHFPAQNKQKMKGLVDNLMLAYKQSIDGLTWMSPATKAAAHEKLASYTVKIGYPDQWRDYSQLEVKAGDAVGNAVRAGQWQMARMAARVGQPIVRHEWGMTPQTVNAYYNASLNEIVFPAAILQPPFFDVKGDAAANYGAIGAVIGHEISHGFDDKGSQFDGKGRLRSWWSQEDRAAFNKLCEQLVAQYDAYSPLPGKHVNGKLTLGENIADLSGLQIAYKAYKLSLGGKKAPVINGLTGEQRFFMGWARAWRVKVRDELQLQRLTTDPHSPGQYRANGAVVNHDGFHDAFQTQPGDKLYKAPEARIRIW